VPKFKGIIYSDDLRKIFRQIAIDNYLNKERFYEAITRVMNFNIPIISYTFLAEKLFELLDTVR